MQQAFYVRGSCDHTACLRLPALLSRLAGPDFLLCRGTHSETHNQIFPSRKLVLVVGPFLAVSESRSCGGNRKRLLSRTVNEIQQALLIQGGLFGALFVAQMYCFYVQSMSVRR